MPRHWYWKKRKQKPALMASGGLMSTAAYAMSAQMTTVATFPSMPDPLVIQDRGLAIEPIVGYRGYHVLVVDGDDGLPYLTSYNGVAWPHRKPLNAMCGDNVFADHDAPKDECQCGIYAWNVNNQSHATSSLWGEVYLWGDVLICDAGYRAEIAYPKTLHIHCAQTRASMRLRDGLEEAYGVPVTLTDPEEKVEPRIGFTGATFAGPTGPAPIGWSGTITNPIWTPPPPNTPPGASPSA